MYRSFVFSSFSVRLHFVRVIGSFVSCIVHFVFRVSFISCFVYLFVSCNIRFVYRSFRLSVYVHIPIFSELKTK